MKKEERYFQENGTIVPFENVSHTLNKKGGLVEVHFNFSDHFLEITNVQTSESFIKQYKKYLESTERLVL